MLVTVHVSRMDTFETISFSLLQHLPIAGEIGAVEVRKHLQHCNGGINYSLVHIIIAA